MKDNKTRIIIILVALLICGGIYYYKNPNVITKTINKVEKEVTINENGLSEGIENIYDAVVVIESISKNKSTNGFGSGFIYSSDGYIITNQHVINNADEIKVILMNGNTLEGKLVGSDEYADIAVLKIDKAFIPKVAKIGSSKNMKLGDTVFAIGCPMNSKYAGTVTRGILSGKDRMVEVSVNSSTNDWIMNVMQTDASLNPGNSGGPLCDISGNVIGVNTMKIAEDEIEGIGFAIPIEDAIVYAEKIIKGETTKRAYLGISMGDLTTSKYYLTKYGINVDNSIKSGVIVMDLEEKGPCNSVGIKKGDVIVTIGDYDVSNVAELRYFLSKYNPNDQITIVIKRGKETLDYKVKLQESD